MKISEHWLREWVTIPLTSDELCERFTMAGLEVEEVSPLPGGIDQLIDLSVTPNRGDCLSLLGLAHELSALTDATLHLPVIKPVKSQRSDILPVTIDAPNDCARYVGRIIRGIKQDATTPPWMQERLTHSNIKCIHPVVDVMNYVMLELGQPMHAFDLGMLSGGIEVRLAKPTESLKLLDGQTIKLHQETLMIADDKKPLAIAGVMGGLESAVSATTEDVFLESAFFTPISIARSARHYQLNSESSYRFERGVDPLLQVKAIERATQLLLSITGGTPGALIEIVHQAHLPKPKHIHLRAARIERLLGLHIPSATVTAILNRLTFSVKKAKDGWHVTVPARRFDVTIEVDLIEEIARLLGYDKLPAHDTKAVLQMTPPSETRLSPKTIRKTLADLGYQEVVTYSFIDQKHQAMLDPEHSPKALVNPITSDMEVMRTSLWPGLINTLLYNQRRQQPRVRIFEIGLRFRIIQGKLLQQNVLSGLICGQAFPEQWGIASRSVDFFDLKGDLENLFQLTHASSDFQFKVGVHPALHPGQTAEVDRNGQAIGMIGALHPGLLQALDIQGKPYLFEIALDPLVLAKRPFYQEISKFPLIRRDIAILVNQTVPQQLIQDTIIEVAGELLQTINVFDVYYGKELGTDKKSIALALILQHTSRTLVDEEVADLMGRVVLTLKERFAAELRG